MRLIDTHCHLDDEQLSQQLAGVVFRASQAGVDRILTVGTTAESSGCCVAIADEYPTVFAAVGIQPNHCAEAGPGDWDRVVALANSAKVRALGETGLDRYWDHAPFALQQDYFDRHLRLSLERDLPFIVHMRDCDAETLEMLRGARRRGTLRGVMHSFTGSESTAVECVELGLHISFAGMVTYKKSDELRWIAAQVPADRILIETDAPYLSPHPRRGVRPNEPAMIVHTAECLAEMRGQSPDEFAAMTADNACRLFRFLD